MKSLFLLLVGLALGFSSPIAQASSLDCSDGRGLFTYHYSGYSGGPPPYPGMETSRTSWKFYGQEIFREVGYAYCDPTQLPPSGSCPVPGAEDIKDADLTIQFIAGSEKTIWESNPSQPWNYSRKFIVQGEILRPSGKSIPILATPRYEDTLLCFESRVMYP